MKCSDKKQEGRVQGGGLPPSWEHPEYNRKRSPGLRGQGETEDTDGHSRLAGGILVIAKGMTVIMGGSSGSPHPPSRF